MDIALATEARGMYSKLLTGEDRERISQMRSTQELVRFLMRSEAWHDAALMLQSGDLTDARFSEAVGRCVYADFEKLYRFANDTSRQFLNFITPFPSHAPGRLQLPLISHCTVSSAG